MTEEYAQSSPQRESAVGASGRGRVLSTSRAFGDEPRVSPLTDFKEARFSRNLGGTAELFVPAFARRNGFFFFHSTTINEIIKIIPI